MFGHQNQYRQISSAWMSGRYRLQQILAIGVGLLAVAALFQLVDGMQAIALGLLRGVQDTGVPMLIAWFSYWAVVMPASYVLGFVMGYGGVGVWLGLVLGCAAIFLMQRFWGRAIGKVGERADDSKSEL